MEICQHWVWKGGGSKKKSIFKLIKLNWFYWQTCPEWKVVILRTATWKVNIFFAEKEFAEWRKNYSVIVKLNRIGVLTDYLEASSKYIVTETAEWRTFKFFLYCESRLYDERPKLYFATVIFSAWKVRHVSTQKPQLNYSNHGTYDFNKNKFSSASNLQLLI